jgi:hypothetical protein
MLLYGMFIIIMGLVGTMMSANHEIMSLVGGGSVGVLVIGCAALVKTNPRVGYITATVLALLEAGMMAKATFAGTSMLKTIIFFVSLLFALSLVAAHLMAVSARKKQGSIDPTA